MVARVLVVLAAAAVVVVGVHRSRATGACHSAQLGALAIVLGRAPGAGAGAVATRIQARCRSGEDLVNGAVALARAGALAPARRLATTAVAREPQRRNAWLALADVDQRAGDASGSARARIRAVALDPLGLAPPPGSLNRSSGRSTR